MDRHAVLEINGVDYPMSVRGDDPEAETALQQLEKQIERWLGQDAPAHEIVSVARQDGQPGTDVLHVRPATITTVLAYSLPADAPRRVRILN